MMIWLGLAVGLVTIGLLTLTVAVRHRSTTEGHTVDDADPLFVTGIVISGAGVALATTLGGFMYAMVIVGLIVMAVGARRTRRR